MSEPAEVDMTAEADHLLEKMTHALRLVTPGDPMNDHCAWEVCATLEVLEPSDLTPVELMAMCVILSTANSRRLSQKPVLRVAPLLRESWG